MRQRLVLPSSLLPAGPPTFKRVDVTDLPLEPQPQKLSWSQGWLCPCFPSSCFLRRCLVEPWDLEQLLFVKTPNCPPFKGGGEGSGEGTGCEDGREARQPLHEGQSGVCRRATGVFLLAQCFSHWGPWTSSMGLTWEFVKNAKFPSTPQVALSQKPWDRVSDVFQEPSG